jgi:predicted ATPase
VWQIPYRRNPFFTGREDVLNQLHEHLMLAKTAALTQPPAITGLGGIGKTQIAIEYAYRHRAEYKHVLWVNASEPLTLTEGFVQIARALQLPIKEEQDQNIVIEAVKQWLLNSDGWLLILDNADDLPFAYTFLPTTGTGHVLLTTREHKTGRIARGFEVKPMEKEEGVLFLLRRSKVLDSPVAPLTQTKETDQQVAADIVKELDGLPLALDQAGAYIEEMECDLSTYLHRYRQNQHQFDLLGK